MFVVALFEGHSAYRPEFVLGEEIVPNIPEDDMLFESELLDNLQLVQQRSELPVSNSLDKDSGMVLEGIGVDSHDFPQYTIEMETGTGTEAAIDLVLQQAETLSESWV